MDLIEDKKAIQRGEKLVQILSKLIADMEKHYGASAEEIDKHRKKYGYRSPMDEVAEVRCPILIVNGLADDNSPPSIIDIYVKKLRAAGKQVDTLCSGQHAARFLFRPSRGPEYLESTRRAGFLKQQFKRQNNSASVPHSTACSRARLGIVGTRDRKELRP